MTEKTDTSPLTTDSLEHGRVQVLERAAQAQAGAPSSPISLLQKGGTLADSCVMVCRAMSFASCSAFAAGNTAS